MFLIFYSFFTNNKKYGVTAVTVSVSPVMTVKQVKLQVARNLSKKAGLFIYLFIYFLFSPLLSSDNLTLIFIINYLITVKTMDALASKNRIYIVETTGDIRLLDEEKLMVDCLEDFPLCYIFFSQGRPTFVPCATEYRFLKIFLSFLILKFQFAKPQTHPPPFSPSLSPPLLAK